MNVSSRSTTLSRSWLYRTLQLIGETKDILPTLRRLRKLLARRRFKKHNMLSIGLLVCGLYYNFSGTDVRTNFKHTIMYVTLTTDPFKLILILHGRSDRFTHGTFLLVLYKNMITKYTSGLERIHF